MSKNIDSSDWAEAKRRCRLNQYDIKMAKELGMKPKSLLKNIPSAKQQWKEPVNKWIRSLYEKKFDHILGQAKNNPSHSPNTNAITDEEMPF